jgi:ABC-type branched-subunit amino acid transport system substrate-binding protein
MLRLLLLLLIAVLALGCPRRLDLTNPRESAAGSSQAATDWARARAEFDRAPSQSTPFFETYIQNYPSDPLVPLASLFLARSKLSQKDFEGSLVAARLVSSQTVDTSLVLAAGYIQGLALLGLGRSAEALQLLPTYRDKFTDPEENARAALAIGEAASREKLPRQALSAFSEAYAKTASEGTRQYVVLRAREQAIVLSIEESLALYKEASTGSLLAAVLAPRVARHWYEQGQEKQAQDVLGETKAMRLVVFGSNAVEGVRGKSLETRTIGAVLPLTGKTSRIGRLFLRGLFFASQQQNGQEKLRLLVRDSGSTPEGARAAVDELVRTEGVIALVGPSDPGEAKAAAEQAQKYGVPMISLSLDPLVTEVGDAIFWSSIDNTGQAKTLADYAIQVAKFSRLAVLSPESSYGKTMAKAFVEAASEAGVTKVTQQTYPETETNFDKQFKELLKAKPQAVFIPDGIKNLSSIVPAMAAAGLWPVPLGKKPPRGTAVQLLAPSPAISPKLISQTDKTAEGAVLATEFFAENPVVESFGKEVLSREKESPKEFDAVAYEAFSILSQALTTDIQSRSQLQAVLREEEFFIFSGKISFGKERRAARKMTLVQIAGNRFEVLAPGR